MGYDAKDDKDPDCSPLLSKANIDIRYAYDVGPGTLSPMLHELERQGLLKREDEIVAGRRRKCARITRRGRQVLAEAREKIVELAGELVDDVNNRKQLNQPRS